MKANLACLLLFSVLCVSSSYGQVTQADLDAASAGELAIVPPEELPPAGTFWSWAHGWASPCDLWPELVCYELGGGNYLLDDRNYAYPELASRLDSTLEALGGTGSSFIGGDCGCAPWLSIDWPGSNAVLVTVHRLADGQSCDLYSTTNVALSLTNWTFETNLVSTTGPASAFIPMGTRSNLFFRAVFATYVATNYVVDTNSTFTGLTYKDTEHTVPDTMGASGGPDSSPIFLEVLNGGGSTSIAVYTRTGDRLAATNSSDFIGGTIDSRVLYDHRAQRWVISTLARPKIKLAVSKSADPIDFSTNNWYRYEIDLPGVGGIDFPTLGLDDNGLYLSAIRFAGAQYSGNTIVGIRKPEVYQGLLVTNRFDTYVSNTPPTLRAIIQPVTNFDPVATNGYAWFVTKGPPQFGADYKGGEIRFARLQWNGTNATFDSTWTAITNTAYRDYYDLDITNAPAPEPSGLLDLWPVGSRLAMSVLRGGYLWTCQAVGLNGTNGVFTNAVYVGDQSSTNVDRSGIQWLRLEVDTVAGSLSYGAHGRAFDRVASTNILWYHFPSIMVNCAGDMLMGFSGSGVTNYVSAYYSWRLANGTSITSPTLIREGTAASDAGGRWGDYSATTIDPADDRSFWTVQEIARLPENGDPDSYKWETVIARIKTKP